MNVVSKSAIVDAFNEVDVNKRNLADGQYEQNIQDTNDVKSETYIYEVGVKDSIQDKMRESITACPRPLGNLDVPFLDDSSDLGSLMKQGANGLRDGDPGDLQPDHVCKSRIDRGMMMNAHEWDYARSTRGVRAEHVWDRALMPGSVVNHGWTVGLQEPCHPIQDFPIRLVWEYR